MICRKCLRDLYYDSLAAKGYGSYRLPLRDELDESTLCPWGGQHERLARTA